MKSFKIGNILIGEKYNPVIIPEIGINHKGDINLAIHMADKAIKAGAQIIKHQTQISNLWILLEQLYRFF